MCSCLQFIGTSASRSKQTTTITLTFRYRERHPNIYISSCRLFLLFNIIFFSCLSWCRRSRRCVVGIVVFVILSILYTYFCVDVCRCYTVSLCEFVFVFGIIDARIVSDDALETRGTTANRTDSNWRTFAFCRSSLPCDESGSSASSGCVDDSTSARLIWAIVGLAMPKMKEKNILRAAKKYQSTLRVLP